MMLELDCGSEKCLEVFGKGSFQQFVENLQTLPSRCFLVLTLTTFCTLAVAVTPLYASEENSPTAPSMPEDNSLLDGIPLKDLVWYLGDEDYRVRQEAEKILFAHGAVGLELLENFANQADPEMRIRIGRMISKLQSNLFQEQVFRFTHESSTEVDKTIPGWERYQQVFNESPARRRFYAQILQSEPQLFISSKKTEAFDEVLANRCCELVEGLETGRRYIPADRNSVLALMFLSTEPQIKLRSEIGIQIYCIINVMANELQTVRTPEDEMKRELLDHWVGNASMVNSQYRFSLGNRLNLRGTMEVAQEMIESLADGRALHDPICSLARLGDDSQIPYLTTLLNDHRNASPEMGPSQKLQFDIEVRDIALACLLHLTKQNVRDYWFHDIRSNDRTLYFKYTTGFRSNDDREMAHQKWKEWARIHLTTNGRLEANASDSYYYEEAPDEIQGEADAMDLMIPHVNQANEHQPKAQQIRMAFIPNQQAMNMIPMPALPQ
jgi:hypothetical protein